MTSRDDRLLSPYHAVRRVGEGNDAPWAGLIVRMESGDTAVMIDAEELGARWAGWSADPEGHLLAALDVVRTREGHAALTSLCTTRLTDFLGRRAARRAPLADGEIVTLVVSIARGLREAEAVGARDGEWWLTDAGRPVLVTEATQEAISATTSEVLAALHATSDPTSRWSWLDAWPTTPRELLGIEARAFEMAAPQPLADAPAATVTPWPLDQHPRRSVDDPDTVTLDEHRPTLGERLGSHVDADITDLVSRSLTTLWRRLRRPGVVSRRRLVAVGVVVGAAAIAVGMLWPGDGTASSASAPRPTTDIAESLDPRLAGDSAIASDAGDPGSSPDPSDLAAVVSDLLTRRLDCDGDAACLGELMVKADTEFPPGVIDAASADRRVTVVDDYGGVVVVRVDSVPDTGAVPQLVVVQQADERWWLRDVYVTQPP